MAILVERGTSTACPSEVARAVAPSDWRPLMPRVREVAAELAKKGALDVYQHGRPVRIGEVKGPIRLRLREAANVDYRKHPERYRIGRGEEGVLTVEPYKSELLPLWRFATPAVAKDSSRALWKKFLAYEKAGDFVGMDMARKYLQMGWTRARRYANHPGGRKYAPRTRTLLSRKLDVAKAESAEIFKGYFDRARRHRGYLALKKAHLQRAKPARVDAEVGDDETARGRVRSGGGSKRTRASGAATSGSTRRGRSTATGTATTARRKKSGAPRGA